MILIFEYLANFRILEYSVPSLVCSNMLYCYDLFQRGRGPWMRGLYDNFVRGEPGRSKKFISTL